MVMPSSRRGGRLRPIGTRRSSRRRNTTTTPKRGREASDGNVSDVSYYPSSDSSAQSDGGVLLGDGATSISQRFRLMRLTSRHHYSQNRVRSGPKHDANPSAWRGGRFDDSTEYRTAFKSRQVPQAPIAESVSRPASLESNTTSFRPFNPKNNSSSSTSLAGSGCSMRATASSNTPSLDRLSERVMPVHGSDQRSHGHFTGKLKPAVTQPKSLPPRRYAYVEDAGSDTATCGGSFSLPAAESGHVRDYPSHTASDRPLSEPGQSKVSHEKKSSISSRVFASLPTDRNLPSTYSSDDWDEDDWDWNESSDSVDSTGQTQQRPIPSKSRMPISRPYQPNLSDDTNTKVFPRRVLRPRPTDSSMPQGYRNAFAPNYTNYHYGPPPPSYPQAGPHVPGHAPSVPGLSHHRSPFASYDPYGQYTGVYGPSGYSNYSQYQSVNPHYLGTTPNYSQIPLPHLPHILESPPEPQNLDPRTEGIPLKHKPEITPNSAPVVDTASLYKPPVSSDPSRRDISVQIPLKSSSALNDLGKDKSVGFDFASNGEMSEHWEMHTRRFARDGESCLTIIRSLEHYADRSGQDRITIMCPQSPARNRSDGVPVLRWLHLQQNTFCLDDLRKLVLNCQYLDEDFITLADRLLKVECAKFERKYSSGSNQGYYIEPGTVLRCDARYDQEPSRGRKSVFFCSVPYLQLGKHGEHGNLDEKSDKRVHPARTLMESLYDYDLLDDRDGRQAILQCSPPERDSILYIPQIWYLLCGSDVLISCSQLPLTEICGDLMQVRTESSRSLIVVVTDLDNNQFSVALKTTDSFFSAVDRIEALRSNAGGNTIDDYDLILENDEHLIPKNWLDIVASDPLPLLKITLKFRSKMDRESLALTVIERRTQPAEKHTVDLLASDDDDSQVLASSPPDSEQAYQPKPRGLPGPKKSSAHTYALTSYKGADTAEYFEQSDGSPTLLGSLESREVNDRRRIQALESHGMVVNDVSLVSNEPEVFSPPKPVVWDYLVDEGDTKIRSSDGRGGIDQGVAGEDSATPIAQSSSPAMADEERPEVIEHCRRFGSSDIDRGSQPLKTPKQHRERRRPMIPFLQWDDNKAGKDRVGGDIVVRRVLDQVNDRLSRSSDYFKLYKTSHDSTLEDLQGRESPLHAAMDSGLTDEILSFRGKIAVQRKDQLFWSSKDLIEMFIPINFDHEVTKKIWGAVHTICQTLDGILIPKPNGCDDSYLVQDYTGEDDLVHWLSLIQPESPLHGCTKCSQGFKKLEDGIAHLGDKHFCTNSTNEKLKLWLRTPQQIQVEARINTFLTLLDECTAAFKKLNIIAKDLHFGSLNAQDTSEAKGYPVFESLVRVFEHITTILVFSCNFMVRADKAIRKGHLTVSNRKSFKSRLKDSLRQMVLSAQEDLGRARVDIILADKTESRPGDITLASIGPEFIIAMISNGLFLRQPRETPVNLTSSNDSTAADNIETRYIDVSEVYKNYANKLQLQVNQRPQKRLLPAIYALEEELDILLRLNQWQRKFCHDFLRSLDPASYRITTKARLSYFGTESHYLLKTIHRLEVQYNELQSLQKRSEKLRDQLQQSIEIEEESHGKAIRVFTFVTLFFLPLSFVTSFFGMNTVDIRDIDQDQRLFWVTSVPTTAFVIGVAYLYGYKWENWKERAIGRRNTKHTKRTTKLVGRVLGLASLRKIFWDTNADNDLEKGDGQRRGTDLSFM